MGTVWRYETLNSYNIHTVLVYPQFIFLLSIFFFPGLKLIYSYSALLPIFIPYFLIYIVLVLILSFLSSIFSFLCPLYSIFFYFSCPRHLFHLYLFACIILFLSSAVSSIFFLSLLVFLFPPFLCPLLSFSPFAPFFLLPLSLVFNFLNLLSLVLYFHIHLSLFLFLYPNFVAINFLIHHPLFYHLSELSFSCPLISFHFFFLLLLSSVLYFLVL